jgi:hypothetical protein
MVSKVRKTQVTSRQAAVRLARTGEQLVERQR